MFLDSVDVHDLLRWFWEIEETTHATRWSPFSESTHCCPTYTVKHAGQLDLHQMARICIASSGGPHQLNHWRITGWPEWLSVCPLHPLLLRWQKNKMPSTLGMSFLWQPNTRENIYVNDSLTSAYDGKGALTLCHQLINLFNCGGFLLHKLNSSESSVLHGINPESYEIPLKF